ncbi:hypothetical protein K435DRAFT_804006 [Dendrothele bispora CBS 962.96]|uniref:Uncharacterized protein n=1 Tax=Dendrothele bispora (strain CBS 962.96) TaxID=1314807 RepID=A0A4S8LFK7_DENBC|nr:hypothetical protein K435DRAFT_804006 [Dendrothele bispora CBS 962.96]
MSVVVEVVREETKISEGGKVGDGEGEYGESVMATSGQTLEGSDSEMGGFWVEEDERMWILLGEGMVEKIEKVAMSRGGGWWRRRGGGAGEEYIPGQGELDSDTW